MTIAANEGVCPACGQVRPLAALSPEAPARDDDLLPEGAISGTDDGQTVWLESHTGGAHELGVWGGLSLRFEEADGSHSIRNYVDAALTPRHEAPACDDCGSPLNSDGECTRDLAEREADDRHEATTPRGLKPGDQIEFRAHPTEPGREIARIIRHEAPASDWDAIRSHPCYDEHQAGCDCVIPAQSETEVPPFLKRMTDAKHEAPAEGAGDERFYRRVAEIVRELGPSMSPGAMAATCDRLADKAALRARSSAPEAREGEAVAYRAWCRSDQSHKGGWWSLVEKHDGDHAIATGGGKNLQPLYAAPSADKLRELVGASEDILSALSVLSVAGKPIASLDTKLREAINTLVPALAALKAEGC